MNLFLRKRKHRHEWSPWSPEITHCRSIRANRDFYLWDETVNVRRCVSPECLITQETKARESR